MGRESVEYHLDTVAGRGDDYPGRALDYYASRGETPLEWGGAGARRLGLEGAVTVEDYEAIFGVGGTRDPLLGHALVSTKRPGMELVIAAHKSVAELGVIGWAEVMHELIDAERDATLAYLDQVTRERGARRGRAQAPAPTAGMTYAVTRHATSRAGDPAPHDHVLVANAARRLRALRHEHDQARNDFYNPRTGWLGRRHATHRIETLDADITAARARYQELAGPQLDDIDTRRRDLTHQAQLLDHAQNDRAIWRREHPDADRRLQHLTEHLEQLIAPSPRHHPPEPPTPGLSRELSRELGRGPDLGIGL